MDKVEWDKMWKAILEVQNGFEPGSVFIGGVAVFAHTISSDSYQNYYEYSHDADFVISVADYMDLKDIEQVTTNRRLNKSQFYKSGFEFDVYVEDQNTLPVPYGEIFKHSVIRDGIRVACLEHLAVLKLKAFDDRKNSAKGEKDRDDLTKILMLMSETDISGEAVTRIDDDMEKTLKDVVASDSSLRIANGNSHLAASIRKVASSGLEKLNEARKNSVSLGWR